mgnify:CR=1 FL=1|jgi:phosphoribosylformylglycinamidine synthase
MAVRVALLQFPGSNCETESAAALRRAGLEPVDFPWNRDPSELRDCQAFFLVGGFSYEDRGRAGILASLDPILGGIAAEAARGKPVLGICNGAQVLVESGLVPGLATGRPGLGLAPNRREAGGHFLGSGFYNGWCHLRVPENSLATPFTQGLAGGPPLRIPYAHAEGRFLLAPGLREEIEERGLGVFRYCDGGGTLSPDAPTNPNGSTANLAGVCDPTGRILALMPHPERSPAGDPLFASLARFLVEGSGHPPPLPPPLRTEAPVATVPTGILTPGLVRLPVSTIITDNASVSVQQALRHLGFSVSVERRLLWEMPREGLPADAVERLTRTGELFNPNKERIDRRPPGPEETTALLRVWPREAIRGPATLAVLRESFGFSYPAELHASTLWILRFPSAEARAAAWPRLREHPVFRNPVADEAEDLSSLASHEIL